MHSKNSYTQRPAVEETDKGKLLIAFGFLLYHTMLGIQHMPFVKVVIVLKHSEQVGCVSFLVYLLSSEKPRNSRK